MDKDELIELIAEDDDLKKAIRRTKTLSVKKLRAAVIEQWFEE